HKGFIPYGGTFLIFSDYMRPPIRLAALSHQHPIYVFTHDSIGLGEDGPTHQPIEQLAALRAIPNMTVIRPADATEVPEPWRAVRLVGMEDFAAQPVSYRDAVLPPGIGARIAVEAASPQPWYRWVGERGIVLGLERFGASAPDQRIYKELGLTVERVVAAAKA